MHLFYQGITFHNEPRNRARALGAIVGDFCKIHLTAVKEIVKM